MSGRTRSPIPTFFQGTHDRIVGRWAVNWVVVPAVIVLGVDGMSQGECVLLAMGGAVVSNFALVGQVAKALVERQLKHATKIILTTVTFEETML